MRILGIESSCDESAAAVVAADGTVLSDVVRSQVEAHAPYGGVVPEIAARDHLRALVPVVKTALANAGLGAVHGFAGPLGGMFRAPHGAICACLLPHVMAANLAALQQRAPESPTIERYVEVARLLTGKPTAAGAEGIAWVADLCAELKTPSLRDMGLAQDDLAEVVRKSKRASSMKPNPIELTEDELLGILVRAW